MRLKREDIAKLAAVIFKNLQDRSVLTLRVPEKKIVAKIEGILQGNIDEETAIEEEVKRIMEQYRAKISSGSVDPQKAYMMIKKQVAKERKFVL